jgi:hypothetical protein
MTLPKVVRLLILIPKTCDMTPFEPKINKQTLFFFEKNNMVSKCLELDEMARTSIKKLKKKIRTEFVAQPDWKNGKTKKSS